MEQSKLSQVLEDNSRYNKVFKKYLNGTLPKKDFLNLGKPHGALAEYIGNSHDIFMRQGIYTKAVKGHDSSINLEQLENLPLQLYQAKQIFKSKNGSSFVVALDITDSVDNPVVVAVDVNQKIFRGQKEKTVNTIVSIHGRKAEHLQMWKEQGLQMQAKGQEEKTAYSKQLGTIPSVGVSGNNHATKIAQKNETSKSMAEKMADLTKRNTAALQARAAQQQPQQRRHRGKHL